MGRRAMRRLHIWLVAAAAALGVEGARAEPDPGAYLAARAAAQSQDYSAAAKYFALALGQDPDNVTILEELLSARVALGEIAAAERTADRLVELGRGSQVAHLVRQVNAIAEEDWTGVLSQIEAGAEIGPLVDGLAGAWALVGEGRMETALDQFDRVVEARGLRAFGLYHKALALAQVGDLDGAEALFSLSPEDGMQRTRRSTLAEAEVLSRQGRNDEAIALLRAVFGPDPDAAVADTVARLTAGETLALSIAPTPGAGMAEAYLSVAGALRGETADSYTLIYARASLALRPGDADAVLLTGELLEQIGRYDMAEATYRQIDAEHPSFPEAEIGRADVLRTAGRVEAATEVLRALARSHGDVADVQVNLGNILRETNQLREAEAAYSAALALYPEGEPMVWLTHYMRGITRHLMDTWPGAEADFRAALALRPDQPQVLNYLGYSLVERKEKLTEALGMIERAVEQRPDNGAIVDSLGWVLYRMGQYGEAVTHLERAAALEPMESVINDHLGDALWAVGRITEARFQWNRALSLEPTDEEAQRIRDKLRLGLDAVLAAEGEAPIVEVAGEDG